MKESDPLPTSATGTRKSPNGIGPADTYLFGRSRYKLYALAAILLLASWTILTGTVTLTSSAGTDADSDSRILPDLDILEVEEREKVVKKMWDVYAHTGRIRLPKFWQEAFEAAYEELAGDAAEVKDAAISEIARMSMMRLLDLEPNSQGSEKTAGKNNDHVGGGGAKDGSSSVSVVKSQ